MKNELPKMFTFLENSSKFGVKNGYILFNTRTNSRHWFKPVLDYKDYGVPVDNKVKGEIERQCKNYREMMRPIPVMV